MSLAIMELPLLKHLLFIAFSVISTTSALLITPTDTIVPVETPTIATECDLTDAKCFKVELLTQIENAPNGCSFGDFLSILEGENKQLDPYAKHKNKNGTYDWGYLQINDIWEKEFNRLGLSFDFKNNIKDNIGAAVWICEHRGISQWTSMK